MSQSRSTLVAIRLLILSSSRDQAEVIEASLRNGGLAVHCTQVFEMDALENTLRSQAFELLICCAFDQNVDTFRTLDLLVEHDIDLPVLVLFAAQADTEELLQALRKGARDLVEKTDLERLQLAIAREVCDLQQRRELITLKRQLAASEQRCLDLVEGSREAIAFFQDGMHVHANPAYLQLFGFQTQDDVEALPLLDIVDKDHHKALRAVLKTLEGGPEHQVLTLDISGQRQDGSSLNMGLHISKVELEGESSLQITVRTNTPATAAVTPKIEQVPPAQATSPATKPLDTSISDSISAVLLEEQISQELESSPEQTPPPPSSPSRPHTPAASLNELSDADNRMLQLVDRGLSHNQFRLLYQSIVNIHGGGTRENYTVTAQLLDDHGESLPWDEVASIANQYEKTTKIDRWVIRRAIAVLSAYRKEGRKVIFFITLSEASILDKNLLLWIVECLREYDVRGNWLIFQISEKYARDNLQAVIRLLEGLKTIKCQIALDQFGLLPNPDSLLNKIDIGYAKIAPSFSQGLNTDQQKQDILGQVNEMLLRHKIKSIVTVAGNGSTLSILWNLGIAYVQGQFSQEPSLKIEIQ